MSTLPERAVAAASEIGAGLRERPGASGTVDVAVTGTPAGDVHATLVFTDGRVTTAELGAPDQADLTLGLAAPEATRVLEGELAPSVAFMRGRLKTAGDNKLLLGILANTAGEGWARWVATVRDGC